MWPRQKSLRGLWGRHKVLHHFLLCFIRTYIQESKHPADTQYLVYLWCWKGKICLWSQAGPLWQGYSWYQLPSVEKQHKIEITYAAREKQFYNFNTHFLKMIIVVTRSCNLPSLKSCQNELYASWIIFPCLKYLAILISGNLMYFRMQWSAIVQPNHLPPVLWRGCLCIGAIKKKVKSHVYLLSYTEV